MKKGTNRLINKVVITSLFAVLFLLLSVSCSVSSVPLEVLVPAQIDIPRQFENVGILNRSLPAQDSRFLNLAEGFISGESILADREGSLNCINGLAEKLSNSPRFTAVMIPGLDYRGTGTSRFPPPLPLSQVRSICAQYRLDALISLETFDSNIRLVRGQHQVKRKVKDKDTGEKKTVKVPRYTAELFIQVNSGWRVYDPKEGIIIDMNSYSDERSWDTSGDSKREATRNLPDKRHAINQAGYHSGIQYGIRISPTWITVRRSYYLKGSPAMEEAGRFARSRNWEQAVTIWEEVVANSEDKIAGRAAYNLAIAAEIRGEFKIALDWAGRSYQQFGLKKAYHYMELIRQRMRDRERLNRK